MTGLPLKNILLISGVLGTLALCAAAAGMVAAAKKPAVKAPAAISMPDAFSGTDYPQTTVDPGKVQWKQPQCLLVQGSPTWLKIDCSGSVFKFSGTVPTIGKNATHNFKITVIDGTTGTRYDYPARLTERPKVEIIPLNKAAADAETLAAGTQLDYKNVTLEQTMPIVENATQAAGLLLNLPAKASLHIQAWSQPEGQPGPPTTQLQLLKAAGSTATISQVDPASNAYSLLFTAPLAAGQTITIEAVSDGGSVITSLQQTLHSAIAVGTMSLTVEKPITTNSKTVSGILSSMPFPLVAPIPGSATTIANYGNFPGIIVWVRDAISGGWSQIAPALGSSPPVFFSVRADGSFSVPLPSSLTSGQTIRVDVVPPPGRTFVATSTIPHPLPLRYLTSRKNFLFSTT